MEYAAVDASAIADDIAENGEEQSWDPEAWADRDESGRTSNKTPGWQKLQQPKKLPAYQKEVVVDPRKGTTEVRMSSYLATAASKAQRSALLRVGHVDKEDTGKPLLGLAVKASSDSKGDLNLNPLAPSTIVPSGTASSGVAIRGKSQESQTLADFTGSEEEHEEAREAGLATRGASDLSPTAPGTAVTGGEGLEGEAGEGGGEVGSELEEDDSIYFARGTEPLPDIHRRLSQHQFVRSLKWGMDVVRHKVEGTSRPDKDVGEAEMA